VQLDGPDRGFICMLHDEIGEREPLEACGPLNALFLLRKQTGFGPFRAKGKGHGICLHFCTEDYRTNKKYTYEAGKATTIHCGFAHFPLSEQASA
jgi:hypothetical protein